MKQNDGTRGWEAQPEQALPEMKQAFMPAFMPVGGFRVCVSLLETDGAMEPLVSVVAHDCGPDHVDVGLPLSDGPTIDAFVEALRECQKRAFPDYTPRRSS